MNPGPTPYANGYTPVQFNYQPVGHYGTLLDYNWHPSEMFCRLADAIFFYLDANADSPNKNSGWIEPEKGIWWSSTMGTIATTRDQNHYTAKHAMASLYSCLGVPFQTTQGPNPIPLLDRQGFLYSVIATFKVNPMTGLQKLNGSISRWRLVDPATNQPFPGQIPPTAVPSQKDWPSAMAFQRWQQTTVVAMMQHQRHQRQKKAARSKMFHSIFHMLSKAFGGGGSGLGGAGSGSIF